MFDNLEKSNANLGSDPAPLGFTGFVQFAVQTDAQHELFSECSSEAVITGFEVTDSLCFGYTFY